MSEVKPDFTLKIPKDRDEKAHFIIGLKDVDEAAYIAASKFIDFGKDIEAVKFLLKELRVSGDKAEDIISNFVALRSASQLIFRILKPVEGELKKN